MSIPRLFRLAMRTVATAAGAASLEIIAPPVAANNSKIRLLELSLSQVTAVAGTYGLGVPAAKGVAPTTPVAFLSDRSPATTPLTTAAVAWGTPPTAPTQFRARITAPAAIGAGFDLKFGDVGRENGIEIPTGGTIVIWIIALAPVCDVTALLEEEA